MDNTSHEYGQGPTVIHDEAATSPWVDPANADVVFREELSRTIDQHRMTDAMLATPLPNSYQVNWNAVAEIFGRNPIDQLVADNISTPTLVPTLDAVQAEADKQKAVQAKKELESYTLFLAGTLKLDLAKVEALKPELEKAFAAEGKTGVNKLLMGNEDLKASAVAVAIEPEVLAELVAFDAKWAADQDSRRKNELQRNIDSRSSDVRSYLNTAQTYMTQVVGYQRELDRLMDKPKASSQYKDELEQLAAKGFEVIKIETQRGVVDIATPAITLSHFNSEAGINIAVPMGRFRISYDFSAGQVRIYEHKDNIRVATFYHPHVSYDGSVCWGNAQTQYTTASRERSIKRIVEVAYAVLCEYNHDSPFKDLVLFDRSRNPEYLKSQPKTWIRSASYWVVEEDLSVTVHNGDIRDSGEDDDGRSTILIRTYVAHYGSTGVVMLDDDGNEIRSIRAGNNRHVEVEYDEWSNWNEN